MYAKHAMLLPFKVQYQSMEGKGLLWSGDLIMDEPGGE